LIPAIEISPKNLPRRKELMLALRRGLRLVSGRTAFGDASIADAESVPRRFLQKKTLKNLLISPQHIIFALNFCVKK